jgi:DNA-3-methyladenine glycosylase II
MIALTEVSLHLALDELCERDADLAGVVARFGPPPLWARAPGFATLIQIVLEQQVSLASARAAYERLVAVIGPPTPDRFLSLDDGALRAVGFSRQKAGYVRLLARALSAGELDLARFDALADADARAGLMSLKGIGAWSADIYLLMALGRADVWPSGDIALAAAAREVKRLGTRPSPEELTQIAERWRPWRAVAARVLWHHYLSTR